MGIFRYLISLGLDYLRWTQMTPMILAWSIALFALGAMTVINFQQASMTVLEWVAGIWDRYAWLPRWDLSEHTDADGSIRLTDELLKPVIFKAWAILSLVLLVTDLLRTAATGKRESRPLSRQLRTTAICIAVLVLGFVMNYLVSSDSYEGGSVEWVLLFTGTGMLVWLISAYSLSVNYALNHINGRLINTDPEGQTDRRH